MGLAMGSGAKIGSFQLLIPPRPLPAAAVSCSQYLPSILRVLFPVPASLTYLSPELAGLPEPQFPAGSNWVPSGEELSALLSSFLPRVQQRWENKFPEGPRALCPEIGSPGPLPGSSGLPPFSKMLPVHFPAALL